MMEASLGKMHTTLARHQPHTTSRCDTVANKLRVA
jgi:hypothetical protein